MQSWKECTWLEGLWVLFFTSLFLRLCGFVSIRTLTAHFADIAYRFITRQAYTCRKNILFSHSRPSLKRTPRNPQCHDSPRPYRLPLVILHLSYLHTHKHLQSYTVKPSVALNNTVYDARLPSPKYAWSQMTHEFPRHATISITQPKACYDQFSGISVFTGRLLKLEMNLCFSLLIQMARLPSNIKKSLTNRLHRKLGTVLKGLKTLRLRFDKKQFAICLALLQPPWLCHTYLT